MLKKLYRAVCRLLTRVIPEYTVLPLLCTLGFQVCVYSGTKLFTDGAHHYNFESAADLAIPFLPWTVAITLGRLYSGTCATR